MKNFHLVIVAIWILPNAISTLASPLRYKYDDKSMYDPNTFEGDIDITPEQFEKYYGLPYSQKSGTVSVLYMCLYT